MSSLGRSMGRPAAALAGLGYLAVLAVLLIRNHMSPAIVLAMTMGAAALVVIALRPYFGLHAFIALLFVENAVSTAQGVTAMKLIGLIIFCGWLLNAVRSRKSALRFDALSIGVFAFLAWSVVTVVYAIDADLAVSRTLTYAQLGAASLMFASVIDDPIKLRGVFRAVVLWTLAATFLAISGYYLGLTPVAVGLTGNRNLLATYINVGIVCAILLYQTTEQRVMRLALLASLPVLFLGLAVTFSRTGLLVLGMSLLLVGYRVARQKNFGVLAGSIVAVCLIAFLLPDKFYQRAGSIVPAIKGRAETFGTRVRLWNAGLRMVEDRPLLGVGPGNFVVAVSRYNRGEIRLVHLSAHNVYVSVAAEMGVVGLALFIMVMSIALAGARKVIRAAREPALRHVGHLAVMVEVGVLVMLGAGMTATVENLKLLWLLVGACGALHRMDLKIPSRAVSSPSAQDIAA